MSVATIIEAHARETRRIGGLQVSLAGLGCNNLGGQLDEGRSSAVVHAALDAGVTTFDTADVYGDGRSEEFLGRALGNRRDEAVIVTKFGLGSLPREPRAEWVREACEASLRRLGTDRIDLYLLHVPDPAIDETLEALNELMEAGKVREIGCSNFSAEQLDVAAAAARAGSVRRFAIVENQYSLLQREPEGGVLPSCERLGMTFIPYLPLAAGVLTGKYRRGEIVPEGSKLGAEGGKRAEDVIALDRLESAERLGLFARAHGHTLLELALSWLASRPIVSTVIAGATSPEQVRANVAAISAWPLSEDELREIDGIVPAPPPPPTAPEALAVGS